MAALVEARNPRCLLENTATALGLGVDQLADLPLPHKRRGMRPCRGIRKQHLNIARAGVLAVGFISTADVACDTADDLEVVHVIKASRREAVLVVDMKRDFGKVARGPRGCACKDHVFHPAAAHSGGAVFAHHPAQGFKQVGFTAAIGPDDACQTVLNNQVGRIDEAFEPRKSELVKSHCRCCTYDSEQIQSGGVSTSLSTFGPSIWGLKGSYPQDNAF